jgi:hypothetical protein
MGFAKNLIIGFLNLLLIISLSSFIMSLAFMLTVNEKSLKSLVDNNLDPFVEEKINESFANYTPQVLDASHLYALSVCTTNTQFEIGRQGTDTIMLNCSKIVGSSPQQFLTEMKGAIKDYTLGKINESFKSSIKNLRYVNYALFTSAILSVLLIIIIILVVWGFPFKTFGAAGMISGSPFFIMLILKPIVSSRVEQEIQNNVPPELLDQLHQSTLLDGITNIISNLFLAMIIGFASLFFIGLILLIIGLLVKKKKPQSLASRQNPQNFQYRQPNQQFQQHTPGFAQPPQFPRR